MADIFIVLQTRRMNERWGVGWKFAVLHRLARHIESVLGKGSVIEKYGSGPCNACDACIAVNEGRLMDLIEIDAASNTGVDDVRALQETIHYVPQRSSYKIYIIDEVHMLSQSAFNALLKTLEEPPPHIIFLFATTEIGKVPQTVLSRCQVYHLKKLYAFLPRFLIY